MEDVDCSAYCIRPATEKCKVCGKPICDQCARLKSWARGCCNARQSKKAYELDVIQAGDVWPDEIV